jgi:hypothetical protein
MMFDVELDRLRVTVPQWERAPWHARFGLSWSTGFVPVVLILLLGSALGPSGLALLTPRVLEVLDPVVPVAVAALGILAGLEFTRPASPYRWTLLAKASLQSTLTGVIVAAGVWFLAPRLIDVSGFEAWVVALVTGVCASMSASLPGVDPDRFRPPTLRIRDLDALLPTLAGIVVLAAVRSPSVTASITLTAQAALLALVISAAAWLLLADTSPGTEQRVFAISAVLLLGGIADYLSLSALASGLLAGLFWGVAGGATRDCIERDVGYLRHPLVVLMLLIAGAKTTLSPTILALAAAYLALRVVGKLAGGSLARRLPDIRQPEGLGTSLLPPGVFGIAFALNAAPLVGPPAMPLLAAVVLGTIASQLVAAVLRPQERVE